MKKTPILLVLAFAAIFCFAGCGPESSSGKDPSTDPSVTDPSGKDPSQETIGMTVAEFVEKYAEKGRDYARSAVTDFDASAALSEFVWFKTDDKNYLTGITYLYTASRGEGQNPSHMSYRVENSGFSPVDLKEIAEGKTSQMGSASSSGTLVPYDKDAQTGYSELAGKVVEAYCTATGETVSYEAPLLRLFGAQTRSSGGIDLRVLDVTESGYIYYVVNVAGTESEISDGEALAAKLGGVTKDACKKSGKTDLGTPVYKNING